MKTIKIYKRTILEKTGYKKHPYKEVEQVTIFFDGKAQSNHNEDINNPRLKVKFDLVFNTRKKADLKNYIDGLGRTKSHLWQKVILCDLLEKVK